MSIAVSNIDTPLTPKTSNSISAPSSTPSTPVIDNTGSQDQGTEITSGKNVVQNVNKSSNIVGVKERTPLHEINFNSPVRKDRTTRRPRKKHPVKNQNPSNNDQSNINKISGIHPAAEPLRKDLTNDAPIIIDGSETSEPQTQMQISVKRKSKQFEDDDDEKESTKRKKSARRNKNDKNLPKRPANAYFQFLALRRAEFTKQYPELSAQDVTVFLAKIWKSMSKAEKKPYVKIAHEQKEKYKKAKQEYDGMDKLEKLNEEQDAPYDIDPFPQYPDFQSMLNAPLSFGPFEPISEASFDGDFHDQKVNDNPSVLVKYEPRSPTLLYVNNNAPSTPSQPQYFPSTPSQPRYFPSNSSTPSQPQCFPSNSSTPSQPQCFPSNSSTPSQPQCFPSNPIHTYVDRIQQISQQTYKQFQVESQYVPPIKSEFVSVQNNNNPSQQECLQTQSTPIQPAMQQIQVPRQMRYPQQLSTNPNMISIPQTPNMLHAQISRQTNPNMISIPQTPNMSHAQISRQKNPNMLSMPQTPNMSHAQIPRQTNNGSSLQSLNQQQQTEKQLRSMQQMPYQTWQPTLVYSPDMSGQASQQMMMGQIMPQQMPQQIPQNMRQRLWQTIPNQTNNQFSSYRSTQQFAWQQQNRSMYNPLNNQQHVLSPIDNHMRPQIQTNPQMRWY
ncbi:26899_t:CDS:2 [Racocetra persica]|uniref:26899_t:CDS:1 n=1 Tax=Racocetra persica TaxID=160502 RepID=A0ACA9PUB4_9GLOM|nr:26899_t:CDS:2 [Racocetra persica]